MAKMFVFEIGYSKYAVPLGQSSEVMQVLQTMRKVEGTGYYGKPYVFSSDDEGCDNFSMSIADVIEKPKPEPIPESHRITDETTRKIAAPASNEIDF